MESVEIIEDGLLLRPWRAEDADAVYRACQDPDIQRWTTVPRPYLPEHALGYVTTISGTAWAEGTEALFAVCDADSGQLLASCGLVSIDRALDSAEVGYWTAPWARGRGVAVRATRAVARWAFDALKLRRLVWQAEIGNHASRLVALRAGFRIEGELRLAQPAVDGRPEGWIGSLLPHELAAPGEPIPYGPETLEARRAAVFGRPQPVLFADAAGAELRLRPLEERDLDAVIETCRDEQTIRWTTVPHPYLPEHAEGFLHDVARAAWARGTGASFAVAGPDDRYAGSIDLRISPASPVVADVGFMTAPHARGRGVMPAALAALSAWGFTTLGLARIEWRANVGNTASRRAAEKAGFVFEGTARDGVQHRGERVDVWVAALLPRDLA
ncbi:MULTISPECIES: GNAT family N-acetyltransferase [Micromonospora]|uniref:GNAT N-acetyltransferase n=1 Tax=Micromonospora solifontis TaxID=2487138 RepID=A0ABX9WBN4_9ACTN|nr:MULTISPECIES: GNAT family N-acetyltransferase [Micromonospora]NES15291.1 GNAT N-acetyltransferase [Micromonospora sp. PPF5-17B]NES38775.1 GNAT N-acetyltransferase [Micromonospora solifontis]NES56293.1 GNAT N-acetyltransferase [Micromonospora sp. PPF5-6]RNL93557.1 GNAT N-acetyltransferase [Micromonospora solifontis]